MVFNQLRRDPLEVERMARLELADAARRVRRELDSTVVEFGYFRRSAQQVILEGIADVEAQLAKFSAKLLAGVDELVRSTSSTMQSNAIASSEALKTSAAGMLGTLSDSAARLSEEADRATRNISQTSEALKMVSASLAGLQTPDKIIQVAVAPVANSLADAIARFSEQTAEQTSAMGSAQARIIALSEQTAESPPSP